MKLGANDQRQLEAAEGWLELGNWSEANEELERITPERPHGQVRFKMLREANPQNAGAGALFNSIVPASRIPVGGSVGTVTFTLP